MMDVSQVTLTGNVGREPEMRSTAQGLAVYSYSLGVNTGTPSKPHTSWFNITHFGKDAEYWNGRIHKGVKLMIIGRLSVRLFDKKDGSKGVSVDVSADRTFELYRANSTPSIPAPTPKAATNAEGFGAVGVYPRFDMDDVPF